MIRAGFRPRILSTTAFDLTDPLQRSRIQSMAAGLCRGDAVARPGTRC
jgi:hypothetical protein